MAGRAAKRRIAVVAGPDAGHAYPALGVAAALVRRGHEVHVISGPEHRELAGNAGASASVLPLLAPTVGDVDLGHRLWRRAVDMAVPLAEGLRAFAPDLLVVDTLTRCGAFAAQLLDRPWIELIPHHLPDPAPDLPPVGLGRQPARTPWRRHDDRRIHRQQLASYALGAEQGRQAARRLGFDAPSTPVLRLLGTLPGLERHRRRWPLDAHVVGSLAVEPGLPALLPPSGTSPLVLVSDSTASGIDASLADAAIRGLAGCGVRLVVTSGRLPSRRDGQVVVGLGPHRPVLAEAAVAVSFGGAGFVAKAAAAGVPHVVVPLQGDQREAGARLREQGAGRVLPLRRLSPRSLRWAVVRHLADDRAKWAAARLAVEAAALGPTVAADLVEQVLAGAMPVARGPATHLPWSHPGVPVGSATQGVGEGAGDAGVEPDEPHLVEGAG